MTKLDCLARSLPDARDIVDELTTRQVRLNLGGSVHDPKDPVGRLLFNVLAMVAEFESDLIKMHTREGLAVARAAGKLRGRKPKLSARQEAHLVDLHRAGTKNPAELAELFGVRPIHGLPNHRTRRRPLNRVTRSLNEHDPAPCSQRQPAAPPPTTRTSEPCRRLGPRTLLGGWCHAP